MVKLKLREGNHLPKSVGWPEHSASSDPREADANMELDEVERL